MVDERELVQRVLAGDRGAFSLLVKQHERLVFYIVRRVINQDEDVEDVSQDVFLKVHQHLGGFAFEAKLATWIARIAYLTAISYARKYRRITTLELADTAEGAQGDDLSAQQALEDEETKAHLHRLIGELPTVYRTIVTLYHLDEFSYQEIGQIMQLPEGTVKSYLFRARRRLKSQLSQYYQHE